MFDKPSAKEWFCPRIFNLGTFEEPYFFNMSIFFIVVHEIPSYDLSRTDKLLTLNWPWSLMTKLNRTLIGSDRQLFTLELTDLPGQGTVHLLLRNVITPQENQKECSDCIGLATMHLTHYLHSWESLYFFLYTAAMSGKTPVPAEMAESRHASSATDGGLTAVPERIPRLYGQRSDAHRRQRSDTNLRHPCPATTREWVRMRTIPSISWE